MWSTPPAFNDGRRDSAPRPERFRPAANEPRRVVLVVEDNRSVLALYVRMLETESCTVVTATSLAEAVACAARLHPDLVILDLRLPDSTERRTLETMLGRPDCGQVIVVSGHLTTEMTVLAMRLGAVHVLEKTGKYRQFVAVVREVLANLATAVPAEPTAGHATGGTASRFVDLVLRTLDADRDLKTLDLWAHHVGTSLTRLRDACHFVHVEPQDARDFVRVLVALIRARRMGCDFALLLDVGDPRTLDALIARAGLTGRTKNATVDLFLAAQQFIPAESQVLPLLRHALRARH